VPRSKKPRVATGSDEISPDDLFAFAAFLDGKPRVKRSMSVPMVDGFLTAIVIGPEPVMPSDYMPWIWDWKRGKKDPGFADLDEANRILGYVMGMNNRVAGALMGPQPAVVPVFAVDSGWDHRDWWAGFGLGGNFDPEVWDYAETDAPELFKPLRVLFDMEPSDEGWDDACVDTGVALVGIRDYFRAGKWREAFEDVQEPFVREGPKVGRHDPCPSGRGKQFKKCCGESGAPVHCQPSRITVIL